MVKTPESQNIDRDKETLTGNNNQRSMSGNETGQQRSGQEGGEQNRMNRSMNRGSRQMSPMRNYAESGLMSGLGQPYQNLRRVIDSLFDDFFTPYSVMRPLGRSAAMSPMAEATWPRVDVSEKENDIVVCAELPGMDKDDINITLEDDRLILRGEKRDQSEEREQNYYYQERSFGFFERVIPLPTDVRQEACQADFHNGILTVTLPKMEEGQRRRQINIGGQERREAQGRSQERREEDRGSAQSAQRGKEKETAGR